MSSRDRRIRLQIAWRSLRWRLGASLIMLTVAAVGIAAASFGPIFLRGADQSVLTSTLNAANSGNVGLTLLAANDHVTSNQLAQSAQSVPAAPDGRAVFGSMIVTASAAIVTVAARTRQPYAADLVARTGMCRHLSFVTGSCPRGEHDVALSARSARSLDLHVGDRAMLAVSADHRSVTLVVSGLFRPGNPLAPIWWGQNYFAYGNGSASLPRLDDFFTTEQTMLAIPAPGLTPLLGQLPLNPAALTPQDAVPYTQSLDRYERQAPASLDVDPSTQLQQVFGQAARDEHTMTTIVAVVLVQLVLLSLIVLYFVAARLAEAREPDVRLAELRGFTRGGKASVALLEPVGILAAALPLGLLIAWLAGTALAPSLFHGMAPGPDGLAIGAALVTFAGGVVATTLAARGLVRRPQQSADGTVSATGARPLAVALDALVVAVAAAAFVEVAIAGVSSGTHTDPLAALAPGLLALALGIVGGRLLPWGSAVGVRLTRNSRWVGTGLATRRLARFHSLSRHVVVLSMAVGLASFAVSGWVVAGHNRSVRSAFDVGASTVLNVDVRPGVDFVQAVRKADPSGRRAMAVAIEDSSDGVTLAVDAPRLAAVAAWPASLSTESVATIGRAIGRAKAPPINLSGTTLRVSVDLLKSVTPPAMLQATVFDTGYDTDTTVNLGPLQPGEHQYQASAAGGCQPSCLLVGLSAVWTPSSDIGPAATADIALRLSAIAAETDSGVWRTVPARLDRVADWQSTAGGVRLSASPSGLDVRAVVDADGSPSSFGPADVPRALPVVTVGQSAGSGAAAGVAPNLGVGLDGDTIKVRPVASVGALPEAGSDATMADLTLAQRLLTGPMINTTLQVWLSPGPIQGVVRRLEALGITPVSTETAAAEDAALARDGIALAYNFFLLAAIVATLLAVGSTIFALLTTSRRREGEVASLHAVGVGRAPLRRSILVEQGLIIVVGIVLGTAAGIATALVALPSIPEFVSSATAPQPDFGLPVGPVAVTVLVALVSLAIAVGLSARLLIDRASSNRLGSQPS
jgi:ABC-type lipoprotein release transport system permease subunit